MERMQSLNLANHPFLGVLVMDGINLKEVIGLDRLTELKTLKVERTGHKLVEMPTRLLESIDNLSLNNCPVDLKTLLDFANLKTLKLNNVRGLNNIDFRGYRYLTTLVLSDMKLLEVLDLTTIMNLKTVKLKSILNMRSVIFDKKNKILNLTIKDCAVDHLELSELIFIEKLILTDLDIRDVDLSSNHSLKQLEIENLIHLERLEIRLSELIILSLKLLTLNHLDLNDNPNLRTLEIWDVDVNLINIQGPKMEELRLSHVAPPQQIVLGELKYLTTLHLNSLRVELDLSHLDTLQELTLWDIFPTPTMPLHLPDTPMGRPTYPRVASIWTMNL